MPQSGAVLLWLFCVLIYLRLTQDRWCAVDDEEYRNMNQWKWRWQCSGVEGKPGYAVRGIRKNGKRIKIYMHRLLTNCPAGLVVDHMDRNGLNNQRYNLKRCTHQVNLHNRDVKGFRGVDKVKSRYRSRCYFNKKEIYLGTYDVEEEAARAYDAKAFELFCEYAELNFPHEYEDRIPSEAIPF